MSYFTLGAMESSKKWNYFLEDIILLDYLQSNATISTTFQKHPVGRSAELWINIVHRILKIKREIQIRLNHSSLNLTSSFPLETSFQLRLVKNTKLFCLFPCPITYRSSVKQESTRKDLAYILSLDLSSILQLCRIYSYEPYP